MSDRAITNDWKDGVLTDISEVNPSVSLFNLDPNATVTFLSMADVGENGRVLTPQTRLMQEVRNGFTRFVEGDVLFAKITPCMENGKGAFALNLANGHGFGSTEFHVLRANEFGDSEFIFHVTQNSVLRSKAESYFSGSAGQQRVSTDFFSKYSMLIPPLPQQKKIARILTTVDNLIEKTEALIEKYKAIKQGMMHDLFTRGVDHNGKLRPHYEEAPELYKKSPLGWIPKEWEARPLKTIASLVGGFAFSSIHARDNGVRWLKIANVGFEKANWNDISYLPHSFLSIHTDFSLNHGDIVMAMTRPIIRGTLKIAVLTNEDTPALLNQRVGRLDAQHPEDSQFVYYVIQLPHTIEQLENKTLGTDPPNLSSSQVESSLIQIPHPDERVRITERIDAITSKLKDERRYCSHLLTLKTGLMQDLLTGKVRVNLDEDEQANHPTQTVFGGVEP